MRVYETTELENSSYVFPATQHAWHLAQTHGFLISLHYRTITVQTSMFWDHENITLYHDSDSFAFWTYRSPCQRPVVSGHHPI